MFLWYSTSILGLLFCFVDAIKISIIINGSYVERIPKGSDVILNCSVAQGDAVDRLDWLKDNKPVTDNIVTYSVGGPVLSSRLLLKNVYPANTTGTFTCRSWKNKLLKNVTINVDEIPKLLLTPYSYISRSVGDNVELTCTATSGWPVPNLQWLDPSGNNITDKNRIEVVSSKKLKLKLIDLKPNDEGKYYCRAINPVGQVRKDAIIVVKKMKVAQPPLIKPPSEDYIYVYYGNNVTLSFATEHTPETTAFPRWFFGIKELQKCAKYTIQSEYSKEESKEEGMFSLTVHNLTEQDTGNYKFEVRTTVKPVAVGHIYLRVDDPVAYEINSINTRVPLTASTAKLTCEVKYPNMDEQPKIYWSLNGTQLTPQSKYKTIHLPKQVGHYTLIEMILTIYNYSESDCRWYTCGMSTSQGLKEKSIAPCLTNKTDSKGVPSDPPANEPTRAWLPILLTVSFMSIIGVCFACLLLRRNNKKKGNLYRMTKGLEMGKEKSQFDLFISYNSSDFEWVSKQLFPLLEANNITYSFHIKDFELGKTIVANMADSVYKCKHVVAVVSENYMKSKFCRTELDMAICRHVSMAGASLTVLKVDGVRDKRLPAKQSWKKVHIENVQTDDDKWVKGLIDHLIPLIGKTSSSIKV